MGYPRTMGAGLAGSTTKTYGNVNVNQIQYGDKLQGLPPLTGRRDPYRIYKTKAGGNAPDRFRIFCVNQLGGIGMGNKNSQFAPNADGLGWCPNRKNSREGDIGINKADRGNDAIRFQSRDNVKAEFDVNKQEYCLFSNAEKDTINRTMRALALVDTRGFHVAALGSHEQILSDIKESNIISEETKEQLINDAFASGPLTADDIDENGLDSSLKNDINETNEIIGKECLWVNRPGNGIDGSNLGIHSLKLISDNAKRVLLRAGYGFSYENVDLIFYAANPHPLQSSLDDEQLNCDQGSGPGCGDPVWL